MASEVVLKTVHGLSTSFPKSKKLFFYTFFVAIFLNPPITIGGFSYSEGITLTKAKMPAMINVQFSCGKILKQKAL